MKKILDSRFKMKKLVKKLVKNLVKNLVKKDTKIK